MKTESVRNRKFLVGKESASLEVFIKLISLLAVIGVIVFVATRLAGTGASEYNFRDISQTPGAAEQSIDSATETRPAGTETQPLEE